MKKFFAVLVFAVSFLSSLTANAENEFDPQVAYNDCKMYVQQGDEAYKSKMFDNAKECYEMALECNLDCPKKKYMSDKKISKKINDCIYAMQNGGKTRQEENSEKFLNALGAAVAVGAVATAVAVASNTHEVHYVSHRSNRHDFPRRHHFFK